MAGKIPTNLQSVGCPTCRSNIGKDCVEEFRGRMRSAAHPHHDRVTHANAVARYKVREHSAPKSFRRPRDNDDFDLLEE